MQEIAGRKELSGPDVILVHRMMKNTVKEKTGLSGYALVTDVAVKHMKADQLFDSLIRHSEIYEHLGEVGMCERLDGMGGRVREGAKMHCTHDLGDINYVIVDWNPARFYYTTDANMLGLVRAYVMYKLTPVDSGSRFELMYGQPRGDNLEALRPAFQEAVDTAVALFRKTVLEDIETGRLQPVTA